MGVLRLMMWEMHVISPSSSFSWMTAQLLLQQLLTWWLVLLLARLAVAL
jgi:hypothetical protein